MTTSPPRMTSAEKNALRYVATGYAENTPTRETIFKLAERGWVKEGPHIFGGRDWRLTDSGTEVALAVGLLDFEQEL